MVAPVEALVEVPESLTDAEAAPLLCAGITTYNALRHSGEMPGDVVAVLGIGGLGHLDLKKVCPPRMTACSVPLQTNGVLARERESDGADRRYLAAVGPLEPMWLECHVWLTHPLPVPP
jgi:hypothetical protein